ncbi:hypothetical protein [Pseudomonas tohonis]|uniref:hypothetical protein n=1 Tax=Pseudomonas tohonis TaxID=2725477 RepID=UPI001F433F25|nr:hypothetical protein [Pseudomonas tohonis]GJN49436.1 hypothetical protein TUM20249_54220 [Pseudomonas tohonis]
MTLAEERAATRRRVSESRASSVQRDLNSLESQRRQIRELVTLERKGLRPATRGRGVFKQTPITSTGGGIAWPLTEQTKVDADGDTVPDRTYYADLVFTTSEGVFTWEVPPVKMVKFTDADGVPDRPIIFAEPKRP